MAKKKDPALQIIDSAMTLIVERGWQRLTLLDVSQHAGLPVAEVIAHFPDKYAIISGFQDRTDHEMLKAVDELGPAEGHTRDRLFEIMMERFDLLIPYRAALAEIAKAGLKDPMAARFLPRMHRTMSHILECAGIPSSGFSGMVRIKGLSLIYADTFRVWLQDDSTDMTKTMAQLDKQLRRAEQAVGWCRGSKSGAGLDESIKASSANDI